MNLEEYIERLSSERISLKTGEESEWIEFTEIDVPSGRFVIFDPLVGSEPCDGLVIDVPEGRYKLLVKFFMTEEGYIYSRFRIFLPGEEPSLGDVLGTTWTDVAMTGVCDYDALAPYMGDATKWEKIQDEIFDIYDHGMVVIDPSSGTTLPFVTSGGGDGTFPVYELLSESTRVGAEVEFAKAEKDEPESNHLSG